jgi:hypothetical protein
MKDGGSVQGKADAQLRARHHEHLVLITPELKGAELHVTADVITTPKGFWARVKQPNPSATHHAYAGGRIDAEIRSFLPKLPLIVRETSKAKLPMSAATAIGCGDLDGDGSLEIVAAGRHEIVVGRVRNGRLDAGLKTAWRTLSPIAPTPLRQPLSGIAISEGSHIDLGTTDRADWVRLSPNLEKVQAFHGLLPWPTQGCAARSGMGLLPNPRRCAAKTKAPTASEVYVVDTVAGAAVSSPDGTATSYWAARRLGEDMLNVSTESGEHTTIEDSGAQAALGDMNLDGRLEIAVSSSTLDPKKDRLRILSWAPPNPPTEEFEIAVPTGVDAIALCPVEDLGLAPLVVATGDELWLIR